MTLLHFGRLVIQLDRVGFVQLDPARATVFVNDRAYHYDYRSAEGPILAWFFGSPGRLDAILLRQVGPVVDVAALWKEAGSPDATQSAEPLKPGAVAPRRQERRLASH